MSEGKEQWKIELHGGGRRNFWRAAANAKKPQVLTQAQLMMDRARRGGVRVLNEDGVIVAGWWRRHAPGARPRPVRFCIGCGCHDFNACIDPGTGAGCSWIATDPELAVGVCSACPKSMKTWERGERKVKVSA